MQTPIRPRLSNINLAIWYFTLRVMHHTYQNHRYADALEVNITWARYQTTQQKIQTSRHHKMYQYTQNVESLNMWWHLRPKQNSGECFTIDKHMYPSVSHSTNSVFTNLQPQSKQITPPPKVSPPLQLDKKGPRQWIYNFIRWSTG